GRTVALVERPSPDQGQFYQEIILGSPLPIKDGRLLAPARVLSEALGCTVYWDDNNKVVWVSQ
ncbi:MAG TPA: stalk domain-containing protein, partial [bacterium]|nr:stalk domain-containing protein [bacterium]